MTQECKCELDGFQGAIWKGDCPLHKDDNLKPMTNNNWEEEFEARYENSEGVSKYRSDIIFFIKRLIGEIKEKIEEIDIENEKIGEFKLHTISILDSHINKL